MRMCPPTQRNPKGVREGKGEGGKEIDFSHLLKAARAWSEGGDLAGLGHVGSARSRAEEERGQFYDLQREDSQRLIIGTHPHVPQEFTLRTAAPSPTACRAITLGR